MRLKSFIILILLLVSVSMGYILKTILKTYRIFVFIDVNSKPADIERLQVILRYQNIIWLLLTIIIIGLIILFYIENRDKIKNFGS